MSEDQVAGEKKTRKKRSDAGVSRGPRERIGQAPINVRLRLIGADKFIEFGCSRRMVTDRFHVFFHPSEMDRYRETRREYAIDRIEELLITEVPRVEESQAVPVPIFDLRSSGRPASEDPGGSIGGAPRIHSARENAIERLNARGSQKIEAMPQTIAPGVSASFGDSLEG